MLRDYRQQQSAEYAEGNMILDEKSPFVVVIDSKGNEMVVRKSSVCWLLSNDKYKLSSDRLQRVQEKEYAINISGKLCFNLTKYSKEIVYHKEIVALTCFVVKKAKKTS